MDPLVLLIIALLLVAVFTYTNGFHDAANAIATVVATKVLTARQAVILGAVTNFIGALSGVAVAKTIGAGLVDTNLLTPLTIVGAMFGGIAWNILTWYYGLPTSSSHSLIGGLIGASLASAQNNWNVVKWSVSKLDPKTGKVVMDGVLHKVVGPMLYSPLIGFLGAMLVMAVLFAIIRMMRPNIVNSVFGRLQLASATYMGWTHGFADGQKAMGIMALACYLATKNGGLANVSDSFQFLVTPEFTIKPWMKYACGISLAAGTYVGGWKIIRTLGHKLVRLKPVHGFAAETAAATLLLVTGRLGLPVSTTHAITTAIMGVGCARRFSAIDTVLVERIIWAWVLTIPGAGIMGYLTIMIAHAFGAK